MERIVVADDLTGACDAVAPWVLRGRSAWVTWERDEFGSAESDIVSVSTESRNDRPSVACGKIREVARIIRQQSAAGVYKKIDSTLKGRWVCETLTLLEELCCKAAVIAPAFPRMGRRIVDGALCYGSEGSTGHRSMLSMIDEQVETSLVHISLSQLRNGASELANFIEGHVTNQSMFVVDGDCNADLEITAEALRLLGGSVLPVGSAGLAASIAGLSIPIVPWATPSRGVGETSIVTERPQKSVMLLIGSTNPTSLAQLAEIEANYNAVAIEDLHNLGVSVARAVDSGGPLIVRVDWTESATQVVDAVLAESAGSDIAGIVLTGGDTAQLVCSRCEARGISLRGEIAPGQPWGILRGGRLDGLPVATKAGGFGDRHALVAMVQFLQSLVDNGHTVKREKLRG